MLFLLRKIRRKLIAPNNKVVTYLLYAIGEIFLVVIGILIAVSIDDWNEQKKMDIKAEVLLMQIQDEALNTIEIINITLKNYTTKDSLYQQLRNNTISYEAYSDDKNWELRHLTYDYFPFDFQNEGFKSYIEQIELFSPAYQKLSRQLKSVYIGFDSYIRSSEDGIEEVVRIQYQFARLQPWFGVLVDQDTIAFPKFVDYLANDFQYKNEAIAYRSAINQASIRRIAYQKELVDLYLSIDTILSQPRTLPDVIEKYYNDQSLISIKEALIGTYKDEADNAVKIVYENGGLFFSESNGGSYALFPMDNNRFLIQWGPYAAQYLTYETSLDQICIHTLFKKVCFQKQ